MVSNELSQYLQNKAEIHIYINCVLCGVYTVLILLFISRLFKVTNFDKTSEQNYILKGISLFLVLSTTAL
jgi:hypothetical protein